MNPLSIRHVGKRFGRKTALENVSLELEAGTVTVLLGSNGAGKSTLLKLGLGLLPPTTGEVRVFGLDPAHHGRAVKRRVGFVPDVPDAPPWMTPRELMRFLAPQYPSWDHGAVEHMVRAMQVPMETRFQKLSRGESAKAMLVAALAPSPELLFFDEAFAGLDPVARTELLTGFLQEFRPERCAALFVTHDLDLAARLADRVVVFAGGRIHARGSVEEVLSPPARSKEHEPESATEPRSLYEVLECAKRAEVEVR